jgi:hypothetical protein
MTPSTPRKCAARAAGPKLSSVITDMSWVTPVSTWGAM